MHFKAAIAASGRYLFKIRSETQVRRSSGLAAAESSGAVACSIRERHIHVPRRHWMMGVAFNIAAWIDYSVVLTCALGVFRAEAQVTGEDFTLTAGHFVDLFLGQVLNELVVIRH